MNWKFTVLVLIGCTSFLHSQAQTNGCDGTRFLHEIFGTVKVTTVQFGRNATVLLDTINLYMDVYEPEGDQATSRPAIVLAFGGAFITGDRTQLSDYAKAFARQGFVVACIDYRIWPLFVLSFPDSLAVIDIAMKAMGDMKASIRYLKSKADQFKIDSNLVFAGGVSSGAITAIHCAYMDAGDNIPTTLKTAITRNGGFNGSSNSQTLNFTSSIRGVLNLSGGIFDTSFINAGEPPMISIHGQADPTVPYNEGLAANIIHVFGSGAIHPILKRKKITEALVSVPGGGHTDIYFGANFKPYVDSFLVLANTMMNNIICPTIVATHHEDRLTSLKVYPNPAVNHVTIESAGVVSKARLYDVLGRTIPVRLDYNHIEWDPALVVPGVYLLELRLKNQERKIVKISIHP